jgi:hypothetical protein
MKLSDFALLLLTLAAVACARYLDRQSALPLPEPEGGDEPLPQVFQDWLDLRASARR